MSLLGRDDTSTKSLIWFWENTKWSVVVASVVFPSGLRSSFTSFTALFQLFVEVRSLFIFGHHYDFLTQGFHLFPPRTTPQFDNANRTVQYPWGKKKKCTTKWLHLYTERNKKRNCLDNLEKDRSKARIPPWSNHPRCPLTVCLHRRSRPAPSGLTRPRSGPRPRLTHGSANCAPIFGDAFKNLSIRRKTGGCDNVIPDTDNRNNNNTLKRTHTPCCGTT